MAETADGRDPQEEEDWGESRGHSPDGHLPASRWPAPPDSIVAGTASVPGGLTSTRRGDGPGRPSRLKAIMTAFRGRRRRS